MTGYHTQCCTPTMWGDTTPTAVPPLPKANTPTAVLHTHYKLCRHYMRPPHHCGTAIIWGQHMPATVSPLLYMRLPRTLLYRHYCIWGYRTHYYIATIWGYRTHYCTATSWGQHTRYCTAILWGDHTHYCIATFWGQYINTPTAWDHRTHSNCHYSRAPLCCNKYARPTETLVWHPA
jgi:hypothetical protein